MNHFKPKDPNINSLYFVAHTSQNFTSDNFFFFNPKATLSVHFGSSHHHLVENVLMFITKGFIVYYNEIIFALTDISHF